MHFIFCQISTKLINAELPDDNATRYYSALQKKMRHGKHFWELPLWIAEICGSLKHTELDYTTELCIITEHGQTLPDGDYYLFSVLDVNYDIVADIVKNNPIKKFMVGGYINLSNLGAYVLDYNSVKEFIEDFNGVYVYDLDYSLFAGTETIPRLTLSTGCKHHCKFCTISNELVEYSTSQIMRQLEAFEVLDFQYVYLNDKTFGQASNYWRLKECYDYLKGHNPDFRGFIVQTTASKCANLTFVAELKAMGVSIVEFGIETYNNDILKTYNKPQNTHTIDRAIINLTLYSIKIVPNIIIGLDNENHKTYTNTYQFINQNRRMFYALNIYNLARYDTDENKNELVQTGVHADKQFYNDIFQLGLEILRQ